MDHRPGPRRRPGFDGPGPGRPWKRPTSSWATPSISTSSGPSSATRTCGPPPMRKEQERCEMALELADSGKVVAMVCSGDPGVYGMAGLCYELAPRWPAVRLEVIPGITAACGGAAVLGAPLMHDFCLISLSDLMTPWEKIEKRLRAAGEADFVLCSTTPPATSGRTISAGPARFCWSPNPPTPPCGYVREIGRAGENGHGADPGRAPRRPGGYVHHGVHRQQPDEDSRRQAGDAPGAISSR